MRSVFTVHIETWGAKHVRFEERPCDYQGREWVSRQLIIPAGQRCQITTTDLSGRATVNQYHPVIIADEYHEVTVPWMSSDCERTYKRYDEDYVVYAITPAKKAWT